MWVLRARTGQGDYQPFRVAPAALWSVENNMCPLVPLRLSMW
ncbi:MULTISPECIES: hypothetical protein [unclassified Nocardia]|nr:MULTISPECIES: hypothetical protein [unclassified Nocardia]